MKSQKTISPPSPAQLGLDTLQRIWSHPENRGRRGRRIASWLGWQCFERLVRRPVTVNLTGNTRVRCHPHDPIASAVIYYGLADPAEMHVTLSYLRHGETFLDVGANVGIYSILAASHDGVNAVAFEPAELAAQRLVENVALNDMGQRVSVDRRAVGASSGRALMTTDLYAMNRVLPHGNLPEVGRAEVEMTSLDGWMRETPAARPSLVKIDVEGHEIDVLVGARDLIEEFSPVFIIEVNDPDGLDVLLTELGYLAFDVDVDTGRVRPTTVRAHSTGNVMAARDLDAVSSRIG